MSKKKPKPRLAVVKGQTLGVEDIVAMFKHLTGKQPSPEEVEQIRAKPEGGRAAGEGTPPAGSDGTERRP